MVVMLETAVFVAAFAAALWATIATFVPAWSRIVAILSGDGDPAWRAEPRLAVSPRRRPARSARALERPAPSLRAAA